VKGYKQVTHTGGLEGIVTQTTYIPELQLGIIVLTNQQSGAAFNAITNTIKDSYLDIDSEDYVKFTVTALKQMKSADKVTDEVWKTVAQNKRQSKVDLSFNYRTYQDKWFGDVVISEKKGDYFASKRSSQLSGECFL
jgi:hypothetical protein